MSILLHDCVKLREGEGGGSRAVYTLCKKTSVLVEDGFPYCNCNQCDFEMTAMSSLKLYKQVKHKIVSNINVTSVVMKQQLLSANE